MLQEITHVGELPQLSGKILFDATPPEEDRQDRGHDVAERYIIEELDGYGGCIIWGLFNGVWHANVSGRWVISTLLKERQS